MGRPPVPAEDNSKAPRPFDVKTLKSLIALMAQHDLHEMDLREGPRQIRLPPGAPVGMPHAVTAAPVPSVFSASAPTGKPKPEKATVTIKSPTPGTFYKSPDPDSPPFVAVGSRVAPESV